MAKDYKIKELEETSQTDSRGNRAYKMWLDGRDKEVIIYLKKELKAGWDIYGSINETYKDKDLGITYARFFREKREDAGGNAFSAPKKEQSHGDDGMAWGNALNVAVIIEKENLAVDDVLATAKKVFEHPLGEGVSKPESTNEMDSLASTEPEVVPQDIDEPVDLSEIPF